MKPCMFFTMQHITKKYYTPAAYPPVAFSKLTCQPTRRPRAAVYEAQSMQSNRERKENSDVVTAP